MSVLGFEEAAASALHVALPGAVTAPVAPLPAQILMKLLAWRDRHMEDPRDAVDIAQLFLSYSANWNLDRLYDTAVDLIEQLGHEIETAGAALLGRDARAIATAATAAEVAEILGRKRRSHSCWRRRWAAARRRISSF